MSSADEAKQGRRGAGRGRRQDTGAVAEAPPGRGEPLALGRGVPTQAQTQGTTERVAGGRGRGRTERAEGPKETEESPSEESPKGSPEGSDVEGKMKNLKIIDLAQRPGFGAAGQPVKVFANHYEVRLDKEITVIQYHVDVSHERLKLNRDEKRFIFFTCVQMNEPAVFPSKFRIVFDGDHICISLERLNFKNGEPNGQFDLDVRLPRMERAEKMTVKFSAVGLIHVNMRSIRTTGTSSDRYTTPLHVLDLIFRQGRSYPLNQAMYDKWYSFQSTVYRIPEQGGCAALTCGKVIWQGLFGAARVGQNWIPYINFDISHSGFYRPQPVLNFLVEVLNEHCRGKAVFAVNQLTEGSALKREWVDVFNRAIRGLKVHMHAKRQNGELVDRDYTVNGVVEVDAINHRFDQRNPDGTQRSVSVAEYFQGRYGKLKYPKLSLLHVGSKKKSCYLPMEHCDVISRQRIKKLQPNDTALMIKAAALPAPSRKGKIDGLVEESKFGFDPWLKEFGIRVNPQMKAVDARVLPAPKIRYANGGPLVTVNDGKWDMRGRKFLVGGSCESIGALILDDREHQTYGRFFNLLLTTCSDLGTNIPTSIPKQNVRAIQASDTGSIERALTELHRAGVKLIFATVPQKGCVQYSEIKRVAEIVLGVMTQCVCRSTVMKCVEKNDRMTAMNLALKINMKLGGINCLADADNMAKKVLAEEPTLLLGIDVTHPSPLEKRMPSISSVVSNIDDSFMRYAASVRVQKHRRESIVAGYLDHLVRQRLLEYRKFVTEENARLKQNKAPRCNRFIIFRDGVAEGQFQDVLREEVAGIVQCCKDLQEDYRPKITLIVSQKRHHTRFFPGPNGPKSGRGDNIIPGTVVDKEITHPEQFEFYLCSHHGIQGTSRPIRYDVILDENGFSSDHIQAVCHYLCHAYARCTRSVSIPAPVYYADLACRRARCHIYDKVVDFSSDTMSQRSGTGGESETAVSENELIKAAEIHAGLELRMYFV